MPASLIQDQNRVGAGRDPCGNLVEIKLHGFSVAERQNEGGAASVFRADRAEQIGRLGALIVRGAGTRALPGPPISEEVRLLLAGRLFPTFVFDVCFERDR